MELIQRIELGSAQATIEFTSIPQTFTDLLLLTSTRSAGADDVQVFIRFNGSSSGFTSRRLLGTGSSVQSDTFTTGSFSGTTGSNTTNVFENSSCYIPNYTSSAAKCFSTDHVTEANATTAYQAIFAGIWNNSAAITSLSMVTGNGSNFVAGSSATLYGIKSAAAAAKATGGTVTYDPVNNKWVHTFTASGTFTPTQNLSGVEYLVIAGGGAGGEPEPSGSSGGGGGAGGYRSSVVGESSGGGASAEATLSLTSGTNYTVTIGAGGTIGGAFNTSGTNGSNSVFGSITATGGGRGQAANLNDVGNGGSGGGATAGTNPNNVGGTGTTGQGYAGGNQNGQSGFYAAGGGGAGATGQNSQSSIGGAGGAGVASSITGTSVTRAGGGAGGTYNSGTAAQGGSGGGGNGAASNSLASVAGQANTGSGGGGGARFTSGGRMAASNGGSGIVIVRYSA